MNIGLKKQLEFIENNKTNYYKDLDLDTLVDYCLELAKLKKEMTVFTGKKGVLEYLKSSYKGLNYGEHKIRVRLLRDNIDLKEGCYQIRDLGIKYYEKF